MAAEPAGDEAPRLRVRRSSGSGATEGSFGPLSGAKEQVRRVLSSGHIARVGIELSRESSGNGSSAAMVLTGVAELALPGVVLAYALD